jgi:hypothetical protein
VNGFSLVEALIATLLLLVVIGIALALSLPDVELAHVQPAMMDAQQRARVAADSLAADLRDAGAGLDTGDHAGPLSHYFAAVLPRRLGPTRPDPVTTVRSDLITAVQVVGRWHHGRLGQPLGPGGSLVLEPAPHCAQADPVCGLPEGATVLVFDGAGRVDLFELVGVGPTSGSVRPLQSRFVEPYPAGSAVAEAVLHTYYFDAVSRQLRHYDGRWTDVPVVDDVVAFAIRYFGDAAPPTRPRPAPGQANCLYDAAGAAIGGLALLSPSPEALVELPPALFGDGPWCGSGDNIYDADLLRVRHVRATIRLQAPQASERGTGAAYVNAGTSRSARRSVPDYAVTIAVTPRSLAAGR